MSRLFYPALFGVTVALAATLWLRHGFNAQWLAAVDVRVAQAQSADSPAPAARPQNRTARTGREPPPAPTGQTLRRHLPSNLESLEISAPVLMQSTKVLARIGNSEVVILAGDVMPRVEAAFKQMSPQYDPTSHEQLREHILRQVLRDAVDRKLLVLDMKKSVPTDKLADYQKKLEEVFTKHYLPDFLKQKKLKNEAELAEILKREGSSLEAFKRDFLDEFQASEWMRKEATDDSEVTHDDMLRYYYEHFDDYKYPAKARFEALHASFKRHRDHDDAWRLICDLGNQVVRGRPFAEVAKARSEGLHADRGGEWDWTTKGSLKSKVIDAAVFSLPVGRLSEVLEDTSGYSIVRVVERKDAGVKSFREVQSAIRTKIKENRKEEHRKQALTKFLEKSRTTVWTIFDDQPLIEQAAPSQRQPRRR